MAQWRLKSTTSWLFTQRAQIKENSKAPRHWPLCWEFTGDRWIPRAKGQFLFDDVLMNCRNKNTKTRKLILTMTWPNPLLSSDASFTFNHPNVNSILTYLNIYPSWYSFKGFKRSLILQSEALAGTTGTQNTNITETPPHWNASYLQ